MDRKEIMRKEGAIYCAKKDIWCVHTDLSSGECNKNVPCDVGSPEWKKREEEKEAEIKRRRAEAIQRKKEEIPRVEVRIPDNKRIKETQQHTLAVLIQDKQMQATRAYKMGRERIGDKLTKEVMELKKKLKEDKL
ncbi:hypothetical protein [Anaerovorax sp. IOR16]|uniref:hypothetical protein n=1 Tax=Anaerovorax sp. IOR16 TaxID=2773458 RepID=UPI0019D0757C|nr:hypothetical protein [Anaerovorax sp. IOR16]